MMPNGWQEKTLGEFAEVQRGAGSQYLKYTEDPKVGIRLIRISDFLGDTPKFVEKNKDVERFVLNQNDILIAGTGATAGITFGVPDDFVGYAYSYNAPRIRVNSHVDRNYILYFLKSAYILGQQKKLFTGNAQPFLDIAAIEGFRILLPPKSEQEKIAKILSTWDEAIEKVDSAIKEKSRKKFYVLEQSFAEIRAKKHFKSLEEIADIRPSNVDKKIHESETPVRLCNYVDVYKNHKITDQLNFMEATATPAEIKKFTVLKDDVIITKDSETPQDIAIPTYVAENVDNLVCGYHLTLIRCDSSQILGHYLYYYFLTARSKYYFFTMANGATRFGLSLDSIKECEIPIAEIATQRKLVAVLESIEHEIEILEKYKDALKVQKQGLMQQLLTGKKRVVVK